MKKISKFTFLPVASYCIMYLLLFSVLAALWLTSNNVWMYGELKDLHELGEWGDLYDKCTAIAGTIMFVALGIFIFFYMFLRPSRWLENDRYAAGLSFPSAFGMCHLRESRCFLFSLYHLTHINVQPITDATSSWLGTMRSASRPASRPYSRTGASTRTSTFSSGSVRARVTNHCCGLGSFQNSSHFRV
jgi:hypothetical protein